VAEWIGRVRLEAKGQLASRQAFGVRNDRLISGMWK
jgi:hypothetical protein